MAASFQPSLWQQLYGSIYGYADVIYYAISTKERQKSLLFNKGWGDLKTAIDVASTLTDRISSGDRFTKDTIEGSLELTWVSCEEEEIDMEEESKALGRLPDEAVRSAPSQCCRRNHSTANSRPAEADARRHGVTTKEGTFTSPLAHVLPEEAKTAKFLFVRPSKHATGWSDVPSAVIVQLPSTGDKGYGTRLALAEEMAVKRGWASIILMAPYYAARKPATQYGARVETVADYFFQSLAIMCESALLLEWAHQRYHHAKIAVTGYSWGGAMTGCGGLLATTLLPHDVTTAKLAVIPCVGSCTPAVLVDGVMQNDVDWRALAADAVVHSHPEARSAAGLDLEGQRMHLLNFMVSKQHTSVFADAIRHADANGKRDGKDVCGHHRPILGSVCTVGMLNDHFVRLEWSRELHHMLASCTAEGRAHNVEAPGGHVTAFMQRHSLFISAIERAIDALPQQS